MRYAEGPQSFSPHSGILHIVEMGLSPWSEKVTESLHHDSTNMWNNFKVPDTKQLEYSERLLKAVIMYNTQHL